MAHELLVLAPRTQTPETQRLLDEKIAALLLNGIDFSFNDDYTLPRELPSGLDEYRGLYIFEEDYEHYRDALRAFSGVDEALHRRRGSTFHYPPLNFRHPNGRTLLCLRPLSDPVRWLDEVYWQMDLTIGHPALRKQLLGLSDEHVIWHFMRNFLPEHGNRCPSTGRDYLTGQWRSEQGYLVQKFLFEYAELTGCREFRDLALDAVDDYMRRLDPEDPILFGDQWSHCGVLVSAYEETGDKRYLTEALRHVDLLYRNYRPWKGCFGLWANDEWLRDSTLSAICAPLSQIARHCPEPLGSKVNDQVAHQFLMTVQLMRDAATGLYRFGARENQQTPTLHGHGNQWQAMAFSLILGHFDRRHPAYEQMAQAYRDFMRAAVRYQDPDGFWHQFFDRIEGTCGDMLYTPAMTGALYRGLALGLLDASFLPYAQKGFEACKLRLWDGLTFGHSCAAGLSPSPLYYSVRPLSLVFRACAPYVMYAILEKTRYESSGRTGHGDAAAG